MEFPPERKKNLFSTDTIQNINHFRRVRDIALKGTVGVNYKKERGYQ